MPKVLVVNNYPGRDRVARVESCVEGNGGTVTAVDWHEVTARKFDSHDGVVLSGSPSMMSAAKTRGMFSAEAEAVRDSTVPILGICFGHQLIARTFGAEVVADGNPVMRMVATEILGDDALFAGLPRSVMLLESRHEVVKSLPGGFFLVAKSETSRIAAMKSRSRLLYGVQFHPERYTRSHPDGNRVVRNFIRLLR